MHHLADRRCNHSQSVNSKTFCVVYKTNNSFSLQHFSNTRVQSMYNCTEKKKLVFSKNMKNMMILFFLWFFLFIFIDYYLLKFILIKKNVLQKQRNATGRLHSAIHIRKGTLRIYEQHIARRRFLIPGACRYFGEWNQENRILCILALGLTIRERQSQPAHSGW